VVWQGSAGDRRPYADQVGIQFKELSNQSLRDLSGSQIQSVQRTKQRQQIQAGRFQTGTEIGRDFHRGATGHGPSMAQGETEVNRSAGKQR